MKEPPIGWMHQKLEYYHLRVKMIDAIEEFLHCYGPVEGDPAVKYYRNIEEEDGVPKTAVFVVRGTELIGLVKNVLKVYDL